MYRQRGTRRPKGTGSIRERDGRFQATFSFTDATGRRRRSSRLFRTRTDARSWLNERLADVRSGRVARAEDLTVGEYLTDWIESLGRGGLEPTTLTWYRSAVRRHIIPALGTLKLSNLNAIVIEAFLAAKAKSGRLDGGGGLSPASVRRLQVTLHKALDAAVRRGMLASNPADLAEAPKSPQLDGSTDVWSPKQLINFIEASGSDRLAGVWRLAAMTGLRRSEICGLKWSDVDLEARIISVRRAAVVVDGHRYVKSPKTPASRRTVELDKGTALALKEWRTRQLEERLRAGEAWQDGQWVVADELGEPIHPDWLSNLFGRQVAKAGLPRITVRQLRHSHATALLRSGAHPKIVQERLGHSSIRVILDVYSAVLPNMQEAVERLANTLGPP